MACCECCCKAQSPPGVCCGTGESAACCPQGRSCCGGQCCQAGDSCCGGAACCPSGRVCCGQQCCPANQCCVDGACVACGCDPPCTEANCEQCAETSPGVFECVNTCAGLACCDGECAPLCVIDDTVLCGCESLENPGEIVCCPPFDGCCGCVNGVCEERVKQAYIPDPPAPSTYSAAVCDPNGGSDPTNCACTIIFGFWTILCLGIDDPASFPGLVPVGPQCPCGTKPQIKSWTLGKTHVEMTPQDYVVECVDANIWASIDPNFFPGCVNPP